METKYPTPALAAAGTLSRTESTGQVEYAITARWRVCSRALVFPVGFARHVSPNHAVPRQRPFRTLLGGAKSLVEVESNDVPAWTRQTQVPCRAMGL